MDRPRHALIIANDRYEDGGLRQLKAPAQDAVALAEVLGDPQIGDFDVDVLRNEPAHAIRRTVERFFSDGRRDDTLMLHFSCHGLKSESGHLYFAARDTEPRLLEATAVSATFVRHCMTRTRARRTVLFLDCCYGGAFSRGSSGVRAGGDLNVLDSFAGEKLGGGRGWAVITASDAMEYAFEGSELAEGAAPRPSLFTHAVVEGLTSGEADLDADGEISLDELYEYVFDHVRQRNPHQTPGRTVDMQGDMYLAHSRRRRVVPRKIPPALRAAMEDQNFYARLGAVAELHTCVESPDLSLALGARLALEEIEHNDIRVVADEARRALARTELRPDPVRLDFGRLRQGSAAPHRGVRLLGPPLARSCTAHPAGDWMRTEETREGLDVSIDTSTPGRLVGDLLLKGAAGEAVLRVEAEVQPTQAPPPAPPPPPPPPRWPPSSSSPPEQTSPATPHSSPPTVSISPASTASPASAATPGRPPPPATPTPSAPRPSARAPLLAGAALALALVCVGAVVRAGVKAKAAADLRRHSGDLGEHLGAFGVATTLAVALATATGALILGALARHDLTARPTRRRPSAPGTTRSLAWAARLLAIPALVLALLAAIAYPIANKWV
ncbi:caspase domain-containing protein [Streptomyces sp. NPDC101166]|uniref:caspase family protein n=1 Tax=Streptomyces sp. NPDC101166 TaxID=3366120 RepID=UPI0037F2F48C